MFKISAASRRAVYRMTLREQANDGRGRHMSEVLWNMFTGSAPYREILLRSMHPAFLGGLAWNLGATMWPRRNGRTA